MELMLKAMAMVTIFEKLAKEEPNIPTSFMFFSRGSILCDLKVSAEGTQL